MQMRFDSLATMEVQEQKINLDVSDVKLDARMQLSRFLPK